MSATLSEFSFEYYMILAWKALKEGNLEDRDKYCMLAKGVLHREEYGDS